jgi:hypothetical protein
MSILDWFRSDTEEQNDDVVVKVLKSKGVGKHPVFLTIGDIKRGVAMDVNGYKNEVVLFLRLNKKDR